MNAAMRETEEVFIARSEIDEASFFLRPCFKNIRRRPSHPQSLYEENEVLAKEEGEDAHDIDK